MRYEPSSAARWLFISDTVRRRTADHGVTVARAEIAHPGVDASRFAPAREHPWTGDLLYAGRIDRRKGLPTAVRALPLLPAAVLTLDGGGDEQHAADLRELARSLGVGERVRFKRSARADLANRYAAADVVVFPVDWEEPWGLVPLEAMSVGTPVVATGRGGSGEYLRHGDNALLAPPGDFQALAANIHRLRDQAELRAQLRAGGLKTAAAFPASAFFEAVESALAEIISGA
jgi:glycosyltransferase involved in cell wall biosynthesis